MQMHENLEYLIQFPSNFKYSKISFHNKKKKREGDKSCQSFFLKQIISL